MIEKDGSIETLLGIMRRLRDPEGGCPWDLEQNFASIAPYTIEEAYEVADAIQSRDFAGLKDELGDLLLQVVFHAQMASESGLFDFSEVVRAISEKMVRRHPHVFADGAARTAQEVSSAWDDIKRQEAKGKPRESRLDGIPGALPALTRAVKLQNRAAQFGFDWPSAVSVTEKIAEESRELAEAAASLPVDKIEEEFGDLLFVLANLARHLKLDPEKALRAANMKFMRRFKYIERSLEAADRSPEAATLEEMEALWQEAKAAERSGRE